MHKKLWILHKASGGPPTILMNSSGQPISKKLLHRRLTDRVGCSGYWPLCLTFLHGLHCWPSIS